MKCPKYFPLLVGIIITVNIFLIGYVVYIHTQPKPIQNKPVNDTPYISNPGVLIEYPLYGNGRVWPPDVLNNQYAQPIKDPSYGQGYIPSLNTNIGYVNTSYRQIGVLAPSNNTEHKDNLLIIMGRPLYVNRNKWQ
jgi:hypothetical protein